MTGAPLPPREFVLIRHGETTANGEGFIAGVTDVPLTAYGRDQARALAGLRWPKEITVHASPLSRARMTAELAFPGHALQEHPGLRERDWGVFEGRPLGDQPPREETPQQGEGWPAMLNRVRATITELCAAPGNGLPILVCHSGIIRAVRVLWTTGDVGARPPNATPLLFRRSGNTLSEKIF